MVQCKFKISTIASSDDYWQLLDLDSWTLQSDNSHPLHRQEILVSSISTRINEENKGKESFLVLFVYSVFVQQTRSIWFLVEFSPSLLPPLLISHRAFLPFLHIQDSFNDSPFLAFLGCLPLCLCLSQAAPPLSPTYAFVSRQSFHFPFTIQRFNANLSIRNSIAIRGTTSIFSRFEWYFLRASWVSRIFASFPHRHFPLWYGSPPFHSQLPTLSLSPLSLRVPFLSDLSNLILKIAFFLSFPSSHHFLRWEPAACECKCEFFEFVNRLSDLRVCRIELRNIFELRCCCWSGRFGSVMELTPANLKCCRMTMDKLSLNSKRLS